jgi:Flp pilus assembly protein TadG
MKKWCEMARTMSTTNSSDCRKRLTAIYNTYGGALVELALVVPIVTTLVLGAAEFARLAYAGIEISNAARAGVAYGSQSSATASDIAGMQSAATNDVPNVVGVTATASQFWSCSNAPATQSSTPPTCTTGNHLLNYVQVRTTGTVNPIIHIPGLPSTFTLRGMAIMRVL